MSFWKDRNVFVTGASGLLGSALCARLQASGASLVVLLRDEVPDSELVRSGILETVNIVRGSLEDLEVLVRCVNEYEVDTVFHLGAQTIVGTARRSPISTFEGNIRGTWNLLEACRQVPNLVKSIVVASSDKAYGSHDALPYTESTPLQGRFPYDVSKSCADLIALSYYHTYGLPVAITRCGNLYGGGDLNFNRLVPGTIRSALKGEAPIIRSDGTFLRDYFFIEDAVSAYLLLGEKVPDGFAGNAFNFGTDTPTSVLDLTTMILEMLKCETLTPVVLSQASAEIPKQFLNCEKARHELGWSPEFTLAEGLTRTIDWYREYLGED